MTLQIFDKTLQIIYTVFHGVIRPSPIFRKVGSLFLPIFPLFKLATQKSRILGSLITQWNTIFILFDGLGKSILKIYYQFFIIYVEYKSLKKINKLPYIYKYIGKNFREQTLFLTDIFRLFLGKIRGISLKKFFYEKVSDI